MIRLVQIVYTLYTLYDMPNTAQNLRRFIMSINVSSLVCPVWKGREMTDTTTSDRVIYLC